MAKATGNDMIKWISSMGLVPENTRRIVIDVPVNGAVIIYAELYGTTKMINIVPPAELEAAKVEILE